MNGILVAATAIAAAALSTGAAAMESEMRTAMGNDVLIGGFYEFGYITVNDDYDGPATTGEAKTFGNGKLYIDFESNADNGLTYGVHIDMPLAWWKPHNESHDGAFARNASNSHESSIFVESDYGRFILGHDDFAYDHFATWPPTHDGTWSRYDGIYNPTFLNDNGTPGDTSDDTRMSVFPDLLTVSGGYVRDEDDSKVVFLSPDFAGFRFGADIQDDGKDKDNPFSFGAAYTTKIYGGDLRVAGASFTNNQDSVFTGRDSEGTPQGTKKDTQSTLGVKYSLGPVTLTASQTKSKEAWLDNGTSTAHEFDQDITEFGVGYQVNNAVSVGTTRSDAGTEGHMRNYEGVFTSVSGRYTIASGFHTALGLNLFEVEDKDDGTRNNDGSQIVWNIEFRF